MVKRLGLRKFKSRLLRKIKVCGHPLKPQKKEEKMAKTERLFIRIDGDLKKQLQEQAEKEHRTLSNYVESILIREIEKDKK